MSNVNNIVNTSVKIKTLNSEGTVVKSGTYKNEIVNEGVGVLSRLLVDPSAPRPSHIYARFSDTQSDAQGSGNIGINNANVNVFDFTPTEHNSGALREPVFSTAKIEPNGSVVDGKITFFFRITPSSEIAGTYNIGSSQIHYLGLAAAKDLSDSNQDLLVSFIQADPYLEIPTNGQLAIDYTMTFSA
jgi:hypothetical protein